MHQDKRIGLALSGGGFRAAAYHVGALRELNRLGLLEKVDLLSGVSGGSIVAAYLALNWGDQTRLTAALDELSDYLQNNSIAVSSFLKGMFSPFHTRIDRLADAYADGLFGKANLQSFLNGPRIYLGATNLGTGDYFFFVGGGGGKAEAGEHELGVVDAGNVLISDAVAASSAFPPVYPPLRLREDQYSPEKLQGYVTLTDGGVYDNLGVNPLVRPRNKLDYAIVSDGGMPFSLDAQPTESGAIVLKRGIDIMMEQIRGLEFQRLKLLHEVGRGPKPLWFSIDSLVGESRHGDSRQASSIGTNLAALSDREYQVLSRHGGALILDRLRRYAKDLFEDSGSELAEDASEDTDQGYDELEEADEAADCDELEEADESDGSAGYPAPSAIDPPNPWPDPESEESESA